MFIDTHCHIHETEYPLSVDDVLKRASETGVEKMICVGTSEKSSEEAISFAAQHQNCFAAIGVHPHEAKDGYGKISQIAAQHGTSITSDSRLLVAIGEIGLDYFYTHSPREVQIKVLEAQIQLALDNDLPIIFHVREAFDDFWPIFDNFRGIRGELHSFTDNQANLDEGLKRGLYVGVNGISTFTKDAAQQKLFANVPLERMLLETDAPFLTPVPMRGTVNEPAFVSYVARHHATIRGIMPEEIAATTTANASMLFSI